LWTFRSKLTVKKVQICKDFDFGREKGELVRVDLGDAACGG